MSTPEHRSIVVLADDGAASADTARTMLRDLAGRAADRRGGAPGSAVRTWAILGDLLTEDARSVDDAVVMHDLVGRLAVRLAIDKTLCVGESRAVRALHQGAIMEGSWGDEARLVATPADVADLMADDPQWRPRPGDVVVVAGPWSGPGAVIGALERLGGVLEFVGPTGGGHTGRETFQ